MCSPRPGALYHIKHDILRLIRDFYLRSRSQIDLSRSNRMSFDLSRRGEYDGSIIFASTLKTVELTLKTAKQNLGKFAIFGPWGPAFDLRKK